MCVFLRCNLHSVSVSVTFASVVASAIISEEVSNGHSGERGRHQIFNTSSHLSSAVYTSGGSMNFKKTLALQIKMCPKKQHKRDTLKKKAPIHLHQINRKLKRDQKLCGLDALSTIAVVVFAQPNHKICPRRSLFWPRTCERWVATCLSPIGN